ncbi:hypothetical protein JQX08_19670 [Pseudomonas sp. UL073]|uniref:Uncharacterized protein n=1 Tax=Zestomonas insulae TaxID=2809017 RepID=A0ABS2IIP5_9GAMM|nr:hypothetical protein [Pseudomonas insulae]MBM7062941.1 hypothetical protein [Pseudomonas insulae]
MNSDSHDSEPSTPEEQGLEQKPLPQGPKESPKDSRLPPDDPDTRNHPPSIPGGGQEMPGNTG